MKYLIAVAMLVSLAACSHDETSDERVNYCDLGMESQAYTLGFASVQEYYDAQPPRWRKAFKFVDGCIE